MKINGIIHKIDKYVHLILGSLSLVMAFAVIYGFEELINSYIQADLIYHFMMFVFLMGGYIAERIFHKHKHEGIINA